MRVDPFWYWLHTVDSVLSFLAVQVTFDYSCEYTLEELRVSKMEIADFL